MADFEARARARKMVALVDKIDDHVRFAGLDPRQDGYAIASLLMRWSDAQWNELAVSCGQRPPSEVTRGMIVDAYRARAQRAS